MSRRPTVLHPTPRDARVNVMALAAIVAMFVLGGEPPVLSVAGAPDARPEEGHHLDDPPEAELLEVRLTTDGPSMADLVSTVRDQARRVPGAQPDAPVTLVLTCDLAAELGDDRPLLAGLQRGRYAYVRTDLARPERTVIHEVAHVLTDGDGHGDIWRAVYLGVIEERYGQDRADLEARRIARVYDRCGDTDTCPVSTAASGAASGQVEAADHPR